MGSFYAVKVGRKTGIFHSWDECKEQTAGYSGAIFKKFFTEDEANAFLGVRKEENKSPKKTLVAYVDGSFDASTQRYSYGAVFVHSGGMTVEASMAFECDKYSKHRNVAGEVFGALAAMKYAESCGLKNIEICYDYEGIEKWARGQWKTNVELTQDYKRQYEQYAKTINIRFRKVKGHSGDELNDRADALAKAALGIGA